MVALKTQLEPGSHPQWAIMRPPDFFLGVSENQVGSLYFTSTLSQLTRSSGSRDSHPPPAGGIPTQVSVGICGEPGLVPSSGSNELVLPLYLSEWCVWGTHLCLDKIESHKIILNMFRTQLNITHHIKNQNISEWMKKASKKCWFCKDRDVCIPWQGF